MKIVKVRLRNQQAHWQPGDEIEAVQIGNAFHADNNGVIWYLNQYDVDLISENKSEKKKDSHSIIDDLCKLKAAGFGSEEIVQMKAAGLI